MWNRARVLLFTPHTPHSPPPPQMPVKTDELFTVQGRLATFKKARLNGRPVKWPHRRLSMVGMARVFFFFEPTPEARDCVVCVCCGARFSGWALTAVKPICRHAESTRECIVARLARIAVDVEAGGNIISCEDVLQAFKSTFSGALNSMSRPTVDALALRGFIFLPESAENKSTVGCILCNCFPQSAKGNPQHSSKCRMSSVILASQVSTGNDNSGACSNLNGHAHEGTHMIEKQGYIQRRDESDSQKSEEAGEIALVNRRGGALPRKCDKRSVTESINHSIRCSPSYGMAACAKAKDTPAASSRGVNRTAGDGGSGEEPVQTSSRLPKGSSSPLVLEREGNGDEHMPCASDSSGLKQAQLTSPTELAVLRCNQLFSELKLDSESRRRQLEDLAREERLTSEELMGHMEMLAMSILEEAHVKRVQLIQQETDRVVSHLLKCDDHA